MKALSVKKIAPLWRLFWLLTVVTVVLPLSLARYFYNNVLENKFRDLDQFNTLVKEGWVESRLFAQESVLRILSHRLVEMDGITHPDRAHSDAIREFDAIAAKIAIGTLFFWGGLYLFFLYVSKKERQAKMALEYQAKHDSVTGLMNRFAISQLIGAYIEEKKTFCLAFIDLDNFKTINDLYGHRTGDQVLKQVAKRLLMVMEDEMHCARFSGDEFALLISSRPEKAQRVYQRVLELIRLPFDLEYSALRISASMGATVFPVDSESSEELLRYADIALNQAKRQRDHFTFFNQDFHKKVERRSIIQESFNTALKSEEFYVVYQPQIDAKTNSIIGVEALARWKSSELGEISPVEFVPIAEESGFIIPLGESVLEAACKATQMMWERTNRNYKLSVNVSVRQLVEESFISNVSRIVNKLRFPRDKLVLEVTESIMIDESDKIIQKLQLLRDQGIGVSLDDFGTGFSSLSMISKLPISGLKIDQSFIRDLLLDENHAHLSEMIIEIGRYLKVEVVAEGVEQKAHIDLLTKFGCHILQGFYFSEPLCVEALEAYLADEA